MTPERTSAGTLIEYNFGAGMSIQCGPACNFFPGVVQFFLCSLSLWIVGIIVWFFSELLCPSDKLCIIIANVPQSSPICSDTQVRNAFLKAIAI